MRFIGVILLTLVLLTAMQCSSGVDTSGQFAMALKGHKLNLKLTTPIAKAEEVNQEEDYFQGFLMFSIEGLNRDWTKGFKMIFEGDQVQTGTVMQTSAASSEGAPVVYFHPALGHKPSEGLTIVYSSNYKEGYLKVRFDEFEPQVGGKIKGEIIEAVLWGYHEKFGSDVPLDAGKNNKVEIYNFPFDTTFMPPQF